MPWPKNGERPYPEAPKSQFSDPGRRLFFDPATAILACVLPLRLPNLSFFLLPRYSFILFLFLLSTFVILSLLVFGMP